METVKWAFGRVDVLCKGGERDEPEWKVAAVEGEDMVGLWLHRNIAHFDGERHSVTQMAEMIKQIFASMKHFNGEYTYM